MQHQQGHQQGDGVRDLRVNPLVLVCMYLPWVGLVKRGLIRMKIRIELRIKLLGHERMG